MYPHCYQSGRDGADQHVDIKYHSVRERVVSKEVSLRHVASEDMLADVLTKALPKAKFVVPRDRLLGLPSPGAIS